jgi:hypothetical protein
VGSRPLGGAAAWGSVATPVDGGGGGSGLPQRRGTVRSMAKGQCKAAPMVVLGATVLTGFFFLVAHPVRFVEWRSSSFALMVVCFDSGRCVTIPRCQRDCGWSANLALLGKPLSVAHLFGLQWRTSGAPRISSHWYLLPVAHAHARHG